MSKALVKLLGGNARAHRMSAVWSDFVEMSAIAFSNAVDVRQRVEREARYMAIVAKYEKEEVDRFAEALAIVVQEFEEKGPADVLGSTYMALDLGNDRTGQFFTPYEVSRFMAKINIDPNVEEIVERDGLVSVMDPCVGGGAMILAFAEELKVYGLPYQKVMYAEGWDIDLTSIHMSYVQMTLMGIPAKLVHGNSLSMERWGVWYTPGYILEGMEWRIDNWKKRGHMPNVLDGARSSPEQMGMFA